jgi:ketosteroid isomerase-like protein
MMETQAVSADIELLRGIYAAFNQRRFEAVLATMHVDVDWPNGMEGGRVHGTSAVRQYWMRQFETLDSSVDPQGFAVEPDGRIAVEVHQVVHDKAGKLVADQMVQHVYRLQDGLIHNMEIRSAQGNRS